jgi:hypothetical protein
VVEQRVKVAVQAGVARRGIGHGGMAPRGDLRPQAPFAPEARMSPNSRQWYGCAIACIALS